MTFKTTFLLGCLAVLATAVFWFSAAGAETAVRQPVADDFQRVTWMEEAVLASVFKTDPLDERLARLEDIVFGEVSYRLSPTERIERLHQALMARKKALAQPPAPERPKTRSPKTTLSGVQPAALDPDPRQAGKPRAVKPAALARPGESDYPILDMLERRVFGKNFSQDPLEGRLDRLETHVYGSVHPGPYYGRVDALRGTVLGNAPESTADGSDSLTRYDPVSQARGTFFPGVLPQNGVGSPVASPTPAFPASPDFSVYTPSGVPGLSNPAVVLDIQHALTSIEQEVLHKTYGTDSVPARLDRLEMKVFNRTSAGASEEERLQRIIAVASAQEDKENEPTGVVTPTKAGTVKSLIPILLMIGLMFL